MTPLRPLVGGLTENRLAGGLKDPGAKAGVTFCWRSPKGLPLEQEREAGPTRLALNIENRTSRSIISLSRPWC